MIAAHVMPLLALLPSAAPALPAAVPVGPVAQAAQVAAVAREPLVLTADTTLDPSRTYGPIVIAASGITIDGRGAVIEGATVAGALGSLDGGVRDGAGAPPVVASAREFTGVGIAARGVSGVTLLDVKVRGFRVGLSVQDGSDWTIQRCDFSGNFHDPDFGWGEQEPGGGIALTGVTGSRLLGNSARFSWDACNLVRCHGLLLAGNDFSHASNTCLKLWESTGNLVRENDLSWGLRIAPGETHARDSTCVLIESGSDDNQFTGNKATHGGDGIFIRVLNGWTSRGNAFMENDVSYANNNGFEAWSPGNRYISNRANHCSYGFWLGASEDTTLIGNEAGWNGRPDGFHNAPESFGHGGIVFVNGPSSHTLVRGNRCHDNAGGGIVLRGDAASEGAAWKAFHWVIADNVLERNRWGVYLQHADWIDLWPNAFADNAEGDVFDAGGVTNLVRHVRDRRALPPPPQLALTGPTQAAVAGAPVTLDAQLVPAPGQRSIDGPEHIRWDLGDGTVATGPHVEHAWTTPGRKRIGVTADDGSNAALASLDVCIVDEASELGTESAEPAEAPPREIGAWSLVGESPLGRAAFTDEADALVGNRCVHAHIEPYDGGRAGLLFPASRALDEPLAGRTVLRVWLKVRNPNIPAWQGPNPVLTLFQSATRWRRLVPDRDWLGSPADLPGRDGWNLIEVPLAGDAHWTVEDAPADGAPDTLQWLVLGVDSWGTPPLDVRVDGLVVR